MQARVGHIDSFATVAQPWLREAAEVGGYDRVNQALYLDMQLLLSGNNLVKPDRMGMAVSIEARAPFLDHRLMEFAFRSRGATKLGGPDAAGDVEKKHWFKRAVTPLIGADLAYRKKQMFTVPIGDWFKGDRHEWLCSLLLNSELIMSTIVPERVIDMLNQHRDGSANFTRELRALAALALWAQAA
jgi:asparagine synthase (glutamine-hydrolysing)